MKFWELEVGSPQMGSGSFKFAGQLPGKSEIANLQEGWLLTVKQSVVKLQIPVR